MNKPNRLTVILALVTFAVGWYLGSDDKGMTITSSVGGSGYGGGYEQQTQPIQDEGAVQPREKEGKTHVVNPGDSIQAAVEIAQPGDTIKFIATDPGHNSESIEEMMPEGVEGWEGDINDDVEFVVETPGFYGYKCTPHNSVGMVGLVIVQGDGMSDNLEAAKDVRQRGKARQIWDEIWEEVDALDLA